jgi:ClpP class serine protease
MPNSIVAKLQAQQWAMEPAALKAFIEQVAGLPDSATLTSIVVAQQPKQLKVIKGTAVIPISGVLLKTVPGWLRFFGIEATGYDEIRSQIKQALEDEKVEKIHLQVDSPGGEVAGQVEAVDDIFNAREQKPVTASIEDIGASGAYWLSGTQYRGGFYRRLYRLCGFVKKG